MELWLVVGREMHQNKLKHVYLLSNTGKRKMMTVNQLSTFSNKNKVVNVKAYGEQLQGVGISLLSIPTYKKDPTGQMVQISGTSEQAIISAAQPFINKIMEEEQRKEARKNAPDADKESKINFIIDKLQLCYNILNELENTKSLTNEKLLIERVSRYTKQLDIDNADDSIQNNVTRYGITGLVKSVDTRISRCKERAKKYNLLKENIRERTGFDTIQSLCEMMFQKVENVKKQHKITYDLIKEGKGRQAEAEEESTPKASEFKKEQMAKVDHYVGEYTNTNNYFSEDRFKQILKDYKQFLVDVVNNNKIDSSWTYVKCRTSDGRKANIIDLDSSIQNIINSFQGELGKYKKEQEDEYLKEAFEALGIDDDDDDDDDDEKTANLSIIADSEELREAAAQLDMFGEIMTEEEIQRSEERKAKERQEKAERKANEENRRRQLEIIKEELRSNICRKTFTAYQRRIGTVHGKYSYYQFTALNILMMVATQLKEDPDFKKNCMSSFHGEFLTFNGGDLGLNRINLYNAFIGCNSYDNAMIIGRKAAQAVMEEIFNDENMHLINQKLESIMSKACEIYMGDDKLNGTYVARQLDYGEDAQASIKLENKRLVNELKKLSGNIQEKQKNINDNDVETINLSIINDIKELRTAAAQLDMFGEIKTEEMERQRKKKNINDNSDLRISTFKNTTGASTEQLQEMMKMSKKKNLNDNSDLRISTFKNTTGASTEQLQEMMKMSKKKSQPVKDFVHDCTTLFNMYR